MIISHRPRQQNGNFRILAPVRYQLCKAQRTHVLEDYGELFKAAPTGVIQLGLRFVHAHSKKTFIDKFFGLDFAWSSS